jgi:hypothetical protein
MSVLKLDSGRRIGLEFATPDHLLQALEYEEQRWSATAGRMRNLRNFDVIELNHNAYVIWLRSQVMRLREAGSGKWGDLP